MTYIDLGTNGPVARYPFQDTLNHPTPLATDRLYLSLYRSPQSHYRADQLLWSFGETVRPGSTSMFAGVHLVNGYSPISPAGVGRLFDFGTHGQINPAKVQEMVIGESGTDGLLAELGIDGIVVAWDFELAPGLSEDWAIAHQWTDGYAYHRRARLEHVRARTTEGFASAEVRMIDNSRQRVVADVTTGDATRPVAVLFSRPFFPGYQARFDGSALPVTAYRGLIPSIEIPAGRSGRLELYYRPMALTVGGALSLGSAAALAALAFSFNRGGNRREPTSSGTRTS